MFMPLTKVPALVRLSGATLVGALAVMLAPSTAHAAGLSDDFNRPDSSDLGGTWTILDGAPRIESGAVTSVANTTSVAMQESALEWSSVSADAQAGTGVNYVAVLAGGSGIDAGDAAYVKVQQNVGNGYFDAVFFYRGANGSGAPALSYIPLPAEDHFTAARMTLTVEGSVASLDLDTDFDGVADQTYSSTYDAPFTGTFGGIGVYGDARVDNFGQGGVPMPIATTLAAPAIVETTFGSGELALSLTSAMGAPEGDIAVKIRGTVPTTVLTAPLVDGVATLALDFLDVGTFTYVADYGGGAYFAGSTATGTIDVAPAPTSMTVSAVSVTYGEDLVVEAVVASDEVTPEGVVLFSWGEVEIGRAALVDGVATVRVPDLSAGAYPIEADFQGAPRYGPSGATVDAAVFLTTSVTALEVPLAARVGDEVAMTATVSPASGPMPLTEGTVTFEAGGVILGGVSVIDGIATLMSDALPSGASTVTATFSGTANILGSVSSAQISVQPLPVVDEEEDTPAVTLPVEGEVATPPSLSVTGASPAGPLTVAVLLLSVGALAVAGSRRVHRA
jgi:hypothetical protein